MTNQTQLELGLANANRGARAPQGDRRFTRANWWFSQMRQVVDSAFEWEPAPRFQPQQILLGDDSDRR